MVHEKLLKALRKAGYEVDFAFQTGDPPVICYHVRREGITGYISDDEQARAYLVSPEHKDELEDNG